MRMLANGMVRPCSAPRHGHPNALRGKTKIFYGPPPHAFISFRQALQIALVLPYDFVQSRNLPSSCPSSGPLPSTTTLSQPISSPLSPNQCMCNETLLPECVEYHRLAALQFDNCLGLHLPNMPLKHSLR